MRDYKYFPAPVPAPTPVPVPAMGMVLAPLRPRWESFLLRGPAEFTSKIRNFNYTPPKFMKFCGNLKNIMDNMQ